MRNYISEDPPQQANPLNAIADAMARSLRDGLNRARDRGQNETIHQNFMAQLNDLFQQHSGQAQPAQPEQNDADGQQPQPAQQQQSQQGGQPRNPMQMVIGVQSPAELQDLVTNGLPRLFAGFPFPQRPGAEARAPALVVPPEPSRQRDPNGDDREGAVEPEVEAGIGNNEELSLEGYIRDLFNGVSLTKNTVKAKLRNMHSTELTKK